MFTVQEGAVAFKVLSHILITIVKWRGGATLSIKPQRGASALGNKRKGFVSRVAVVESR